VNVDIMISASEGARIDEKWLVLQFKENPAWWRNNTALDFRTISGKCDSKYIPRHGTRRNQEGIPYYYLESIR
jgi:hypothetical protein